MRGDKPRAFLQGQGGNTLRTIHTERDIDDLRRGTAAYAVLLAWAGGGLLKKLADEGPMTAADLPGDVRAIEITAPILGNMGILCRQGDAWALTPTAKGLVDAGSFNIGGPEDNLGPLSRLAPVLAEGGPVRTADGKPMVTEGGVREDDPDRASAFMAMLYRRSEVDVGVVASVLGSRVQKGARFLDLGGGHGRYAQALVEQGMKATLFDRKVCVAIASERYGDTLSYMEGDFQKDPLGGPYDLVLMSNIVHSLGPGENLDLLRKTRGSLAPGGMVAIKDMFLDGFTCHPESAAVFGLTMLMYTREGQSYTFDAMARICRDAGLEPMDHVFLPDRGYSLMMARRPA